MNTAIEVKTAEALDGEISALALSIGNNTKAVQSLGVDIALHAKANSNDVTLFERFVNALSETGYNVAAVCLWIQTFTPTRFAKNGNTYTAKAKKGERWLISRLEATPHQSFRKQTETPVWDLDKRFVAGLKGMQARYTKAVSGEVDATGLLLGKSDKVQEIMSEAIRKLEAVEAQAKIDAGTVTLERDSEGQEESADNSEPEKVSENA